MRTDQAIRTALQVLLHSGKTTETEHWQAVKAPDRMVSVDNIFLKMDLEEDIGTLARLTCADLPWAEDHFQERLAGPSNPGVQYKKWPYYRPSTDDGRFRRTGKFSHTYQERFWPPKKTGIRFPMGDYTDVKERLKSDRTTRQAFLAIWHPEDQYNHGERVPCTIGYWFKITDSQLNITYLIRSCDAVRHFRNDIYMAQRLAHDVAEHVGGCTLGELSMWIGDFHCFVNDLYTLKKQIK